MSVTPAVHTALTEAMDRLLDGEPQHSDGNLTVASLAREAGISRATAYRANDVLELFRQRVDERSSGPDVPTALRERIQELQGQLREARRGRHTRRSPTFVSPSTHSPNASRPSPSIASNCAPSSLGAAHSPSYPWLGHRPAEFPPGSRSLI
jgi:hypothetical protein